MLLVIYLTIYIYIYFVTKLFLKCIKRLYFMIFYFIYRHLKLNLEAVYKVIVDKCSLIDFLLLRSESKDAILQVIFY